MNSSFIYQSHPQKIVFGAGSLAGCAREVELLGSRRAFILATPQQRTLADQVAALLGLAAVAIFDQAVMHVPAEVATRACEIAANCDVDCLVAVGGGSTTGLAKAIALRTGLPILAIPTTYAGSEMTSIYGITESNLKRTGRDARVLPRTVIYDPALTAGLPVGMSMTSGINAIAHAAEGLYAPDSNPIMALMAEEGIRSMRLALPTLYASAHDAQARSQALYGAWLCGSVLGNVGMGLHHKLCHTLGGTFNLPHAETHTVILPHALAYNAQHAPEAMLRIRRALGLEDQSVSAPQGIFDLIKSVGTPVSLREIGMHARDLDLACDTALQYQYPNPRPLERAVLRELLQHAFDGVRPL
jgi:maleylacetate reductase